jgi:hypothetical protein
MKGRILPRPSLNKGYNKFDIADPLDWMASDQMKAAKPSGTSWIGCHDQTALINPPATANCFSQKLFFRLAFLRRKTKDASTALGSVLPGCSNRFHRTVTAVHILKCLQTRLQKYMRSPLLVSNVHCLLTCEE